MTQEPPPPRPIPPPPPRAGSSSTATAPPPPRPLAQTRRGVIAVAVGCAVLAVIVAALAVIGFRQGWISFGLASRGLVGAAVPALALLACAFGLIGLGLALVARPRGGAATAAVALALGALTFALWTQANSVDVRFPPVHDVATDWTDPLTFSPKVMAARGPRANPVELAPAVPEGPSRGASPGFLGRPVAQVNAQTCPEAAPAVVTTSPAAAYAKLKAAVQKDGMAVLTDDPQGGRIEAAAARGLWGVRDDLVGRVRAEGAGARVDLRSIARAGLNDGGANCARIGRIRHALAG